MMERSGQSFFIYKEVLTFKNDNFFGGVNQKNK